MPDLLTIQGVQKAIAAARAVGQQPPFHLFAAYEQLDPELLNVLAPHPGVGKVDGQLCWDVSAIERHAPPPPPVVEGRPLDPVVDGHGCGWMVER